MNSFKLGLLVISTAAISNTFALTVGKGVDTTKTAATIFVNDNFDTVFNKTRRKVEKKYEALYQAILDGNLKKVDKFLSNSQYVISSEILEELITLANNMQETEHINYHCAFFIKRPLVKRTWRNRRRILSNLYQFKNLQKTLAQQASHEESTIKQA